MNSENFTKDNNKQNTNNLIPREVIFNNPDKVRVKLSYDGKHISYLAPKNNVLNIFIAPFDNPKKAKSITDDAERGIGSYAWSCDNRYIIFSKDNKGDENTRLYSYNLSTLETKLLTPENKVKTSLLKGSISKPNEIAIGSNERDAKFFDVYSLNLDSGEKKLIFKNEEYNNFILDDQLNLRFTSKLDKDGNEIHYEYKDGIFKEFITFPYEDTANSGLISLDHSGKILYFSDSRDKNLGVLKKYNLETGDIEVMSEGKKGELGILTIHPTTKIVQAITEEYDRVSYTILDEEIKSDIDYLLNVERGVLNIGIRTHDDKKWLVVYDSDNFPSKYYYYDRQTKTATYLFSHSEALEKFQLAQMHPVIIKSRDDFDLVSYLTLPKTENVDESLQPTAPLPMVLYVHGGPWARDSLGLDNTHQWLADRGYAVLSVNFRGSTGFGKEFYNAGNLQWGKKMHDDLIDAVNWATSKKIADSSKVAIYGGSYGGYATLCGLTLTPDVFACGIDVVGPSNLYTLLVSFPQYWIPVINKFKKAVGNWETDDDKLALASVSPISHVDKITKPLLIAQGDNDVRVTRIESDQIFDAMQKKDLDVIYLRYPEEGHGFGKAGNKKSFIAIMEQFLAKHLGGKFEPLKASDFDEANFILNNEPVNIEEAGSEIYKLLESE